MQQIITNDIYSTNGKYRCSNIDLLILISSIQSVTLCLVKENVAIHKKLVSKMKNWRGGFKPEPVFGNNLENLPLCPGLSTFYRDAHQLPEFIVRCVEKIETMISTDGLYRINGETEAVQKLRLNVFFETY